MLTWVNHCSLHVIKNQWVEIYNVPLARDKRLRRENFICLTCSKKKERKKCYASMCYVLKKGFCKNFNLPFDNNSLIIF